MTDYLSFLGQLLDTEEPQINPPCAICYSAGEYIKATSGTAVDEGQYRRLPLGDWGGFAERTWCPTCLQIVQHFTSRKPPCNNMTMSCSLILDDHGNSFDIRCKHEYGKPGAKQGHFHRPLRFFKPQDMLPNGPYYISLDPGTIDIEQLRGWLLKCDEDHAESCHTLLDLQKIETAPPLTFINVNRLCLVTPRETVSYATLSYVWGYIPGTLMATLRNLDLLRIPGSLETPELKDHIPRTILDAIHFTKLMGVDYLWVDRLCITQDSTRHFNEQLQQMASIYNRAHFTIVAANGQDANFGLRGVGGQAPDRVYSQAFYRFSDTSFLCETDPESIWDLPNWYTRAWTFQERSVSRKTFVFVNGTVYWECRSNTWHESVRATENIWKSMPSVGWPSHTIFQTPWPDLKTYFDLVRGYNSRCLTYEDDALKAFSAIMDVFGRSFHAGFLFGIPELVFDIGLLWSSKKPLKRRKAFPSWSWLGWSGEINLSGYSAWRPHEDWAAERVVIVPIVEWEKKDNDRVTKVDNSYCIYQSMRYGDSELQLPVGWSRKEDLFAHDQIPDKTFLHPFPMASNYSPQRKDVSPLISCQANKGNLFLGPVLPSVEDAPRQCLTIALTDDNGSQIGILECSDLTDEKDYTQGQQCEVIAISKGFAVRDQEIPEELRELLPETYQVFDEMEIFPELQYEAFYHFYNVLWIDVEEGISYRKAVGRVMRDAWERQDLQSVKVTLG